MSKENQLGFIQRGEIKRREVSWTLTKKLDAFTGPGEIKRRGGGEGCWTHKLVQKRSRCREVELGLRVGLLSLQLFPTCRTTDIVTLFCIAVGTATAWCGGRCAMSDGHRLNTLLFWRRSTADLVFRVGACFEVSLFFPHFPARPRPY